MFNSPWDSVTAFPLRNNPLYRVKLLLTQVRRSNLQKYTRMYVSMTAQMWYTFAGRNVALFKVQSSNAQHILETESPLSRVIVAHQSSRSLRILRPFSKVSPQLNPESVVSDVVAVTTGLDKRIL